MFDHIFAENLYFFADFCWRQQKISKIWDFCFALLLEVLRKDYFRAKFQLPRTSIKKPIQDRVKHNILNPFC